MPKENMHYSCIAWITIDSVIDVNKKNHPQVYLEECKLLLMIIGYYWWLLLIIGYYWWLFVIVIKKNLVEVYIRLLGQFWTFHFFFMIRFQKYKKH